jgi:ribosomal protein S18 acetylase RimI-like enzyme
MPGGGSLDPTLVVRAIEESMASYWLALGHASRATIGADSELTWVYSGRPTMNRVVRTRLDEHGADDRIRGLSGHLAGWGADLSWLTTPLSTPADLPDRLKARGFSEAAFLCGMALDLEQAPDLLAAAPEPEGFSVREVAKAGDEVHRHWLQVVRQSFQLPDSAVDALGDPSVGTGMHGPPPWNRYVGYLDGRPVATVTLVVTRLPGGGTVGGLYLVGTLPDAERRGLATALTRRALRAAWERGCRLIVLQATDPARGLYHSLGFREYCRVGIYRKAAPLARLHHAQYRVLRAASRPAALVPLAMLALALVAMLGTAAVSGLFSGGTRAGPIGGGIAAPVAPTAPVATATAVPPTPAPPTPTPTPDPRGSILERRQLAAFSAAQVNQIAPRSYAPGTAPAARYAVEQHLLRFVSTDEKTGDPLEISAHLYVPRLDAPAELPVFVYGAGTTGLDDQCAPTREQPAVRNWGDYQVHMLLYAAQGYISILPDYAGFNDPARLNRYFVAESESRVMLDAARAVFKLYETQPFAGTPAAPATPQQAVFFAGYSVGGHAAFGVRDIVSRYAPGMPIKGVIGHGASNDVTALFRDSPYFAPYVLQSFADYYGAGVVEPGRVLQTRWANTLAQDVVARCIDAMPGYYGTNPSVVYQPAFQDALYNNRLEQGYPALKEVLDRNLTGLASSSIPALVVQGGGDPIVTARSQDAFVSRLCAAGGRVTYITYPGVHHFQTRQVGFRDTHSWMQTISGGGAPRTTC